MTAPVLFHGTTLSFGAFFAKLTSIRLTGVERDAVDVTNADSTTLRQYVPNDVYDAGEIEVEMLFDAASTPPMTGAAATATITWKDLNTSTGTAFMTSFEPAGQERDAMRATARLKITDTWTW
jgi:hypothetical protein